MNFLPCTLAGNQARVGDAIIDLDPDTARRATGATGKLELGIRPMHLLVSAVPIDGGVAAIVRGVEDQGSFKILTLMMNAHTLRARIPEGHPVPESRAWIKFPLERTKLFADERLIA